MAKLGINIDHVATLRQQRREFDPDPLAAAKTCERAGADSIVCHLREDRRHIQEDDVKRLRKLVQTRLNLEMSLNSEIIAIALKIKPDLATIVPERRQELTTEGGLDVIKSYRRVTNAIKRLQDHKIAVSLFIDPVKRQIEYAKASGAEIIELHTGCYAAAQTRPQILSQLKKLAEMTRFAKSLGLKVSAGHGLKYHNVRAVALIPGVEELNIGHSIISRAVMVGLAKAVQEMKRAIRP
jgi:pyridoxine 5-phosphate synthase